MSGGMFVGMSRLDFLIPGSTSLKDKRRVVRSLVAAVTAKFKVAIAEVDYQDLRQRGAVGISCVSNSHFHAEQVIQEVQRFISAHYSIDLVQTETEIATLDA